MHDWVLVEVSDDDRANMEADYKKIITTIELCLATTVMKITFADGTSETVEGRNEELDS